MSGGSTPCRQLRPSSRREHVKASKNYMEWEKKEKKQQKEQETAASKQNDNLGYKQIHNSTRPSPEDKPTLPNPYNSKALAEGNKVVVLNQEEIVLSPKPQVNHDISILSWNVNGWTRSRNRNNARSGQFANFCFYH